MRTMSAIPKIVASLRLSPDPETRADAERLEIAYQRELRAVDASLKEPHRIEGET